NYKGSSAFYLDRPFPTSSSLCSADPQFHAYSHVVQGPHKFETIEVAVETLDDLNRYEPPYLLKLDVEGSEFQVVEVAVRTLSQTDMIVSEISVMRRKREERSFAEMIACYDDYGFELFDIPSLSQANGNGCLLYLDAAFVRKGSSLWPGVSGRSNERVV